MVIVLMRHGRPEMDLDILKKHRVSPIKVGQIIAEYETSELDADQTVPQASIDIAKSCDVVICSDLPRAVGSAQKLGVEYRADANLKEAGLPYLTWQRPMLSCYRWVMMFRLAWFMGFSQNGESFTAANKRALSAADQLIDCAFSQQRPLYLGHGIMNRLVARQLKAQGWRCSQHSDEKYWSFSVFRRAAP